MSTFQLLRWGTSHVPDTAIALIDARQCRDDLRPEILVWALGGCDQHVTRISKYAALRVIVFAERRRIKPKPDAIFYAVVDGMERARRRKCSTPLNRRAKQVGMNLQDFSDLRDAAERCLLNAVQEGLCRYLAAYRGEFDSWAKVMLATWSVAPDDYQPRKADAAARSHRTGVRDSAPRRDLRIAA